jgi:hypothetical protein
MGLLARGLVRGVGSTVVLVIVVASCSLLPPPSPAVSPPPVAPSPELADLTEAEIAKAVWFRETFGLRADIDWIRQVAADPRAKGTLGVPLTPDELAEIQSRQAALDSILPRVIAYGQQHPDVWAGVEIDQDRGGVLVIRVSGDAAAHQATLRNLLGPRPVFEVLDVDWSEAQLRSFIEKIKAEDLPNAANALESTPPWMRAIPATRIVVGFHVDLNKVVMEVSSPRPDAVRLVTEHYGNPPWLVVESDGTGFHLLQSGSIVVTARDPAGQSVQGLNCVFRPDTGWDSEIATTDKHGECRAQLRSTGYWVELSWGELTSRTVVATDRAVILPGRETKLKVTVTSD